MFNRWSLIQHDFWTAGVRKGRTKQAVNIATWLVLANMSESMIRHYSKELISSITGTEPPEEKELSEQVIKQAISNVPFVSSFASSAEHGSVPVPSISMIESTAESLSFADKSKSSEKKTKHYLNAALMGFGSIFGVSGSLQAKQLSKGLFDSDKKKGKKGDSEDVLFN